MSSTGSLMRRPLVALLLTSSHPTTLRFRPTTTPYTLSSSSSSSSTPFSFHSYQHVRARQLRFYTTATAKAPKANPIKKLTATLTSLPKTVLSKFQRKKAEKIEAAPAPPPPSNAKISTEVQETDCTVEPKVPERVPVRSIKDQLMIYLHLGKHRLTSLVVFTTFIGFYMSHGTLATSAILLTGTTLQSLSANGLNQVIERRVDALMSRTKHRPMVVKSLSVPHALAMLTGSVVVGTSMLYFGCNPLTAYLGFATWGLYVFVYTPMKRYHFTNTWVGAVVGMLPPMMGVAAVTNGLGPMAVFLGGVLFIWQIPHFMSLSYLCRNEYRSAGFKMLPSQDVWMASNQAYLHALLLLAWCAAFTPYINAEPLFFAEMLALNVYMVKCSLWYKRNPSVQWARHLFRYSILYLTLLCLLMMWHRTDKTFSISEILASWVNTFCNCCGTVWWGTKTVVKTTAQIVWWPIDKLGRFLIASVKKIPSLIPKSKPQPTWPPTWEVSD